MLHRKGSTSRYNAGIKLKHIAAYLSFCVSTCRHDHVKQLCKHYKNKEVLLYTLQVFYNN